MKQRGMRTLWSILLALGLVASTLGASPASAAQSLGDFYNSTNVHEVYLTIDSASTTNLDKAPKDYTAATVQFKTANGSSSGQISIGLRLKGSTSLEKLSGAAQMRLPPSSASNAAILDSASHSPEVPGRMISLVCVRHSCLFVS